MYRLFSFKVVEQRRKLCTWHKTVRMTPLAPFLIKGMLGFLVLFFSDAHPMLRNKSPAKTSLIKISKSGQTSRLPESSQAPVVKSEPLDDDEILPYVRSPGMKKDKEKLAMRFSSPIVISSEESDALTPKAKPVKTYNTFSPEKVKKSYVLCNSIPLPFLITKLVLLQPRERRVRESQLCDCLAPWLFQAVKATFPLVTALMGTFVLCLFIPWFLSLHKRFS